MAEPLRAQVEVAQKAVKANSNANTVDNIRLLAADAKNVE